MPKHPEKGIGEYKKHVAQIAELNCMFFIFSDLLNSKFFYKL